MSAISLREQWVTVASMYNDPDPENTAQLKREEKKRKDQLEIDRDLRNGVKSNSAKTDTQGNTSQKNASAFMQDAIRQQMLRLQINGKDFNISIGQLDEDAKDRLKNLDKEANELLAKGDADGYTKKVKAKTAWQEYQRLRENGGSPAQLQEAMENVLKYDEKYSEKLLNRENAQNLKTSAIKGSDKYDISYKSDFNKVAINKAETSIYTLLQADEPYSKELGQKAQKYLEKGDSARYQSTMQAADEWNKDKLSLVNSQDVKQEANARLQEAAETPIAIAQGDGTSKNEGIASTATPSKVFSF